MQEEEDHDGTGTDATRLLRLWHYRSFATWTVARYLTEGWPDVGLRRRVLEDPLLRRVTVAEVVATPDTLEAFLAECRGIPECGARQLARIRQALLSAAAPPDAGGTAPDPASGGGGRLRIDPDARQTLLRKWAFILGNTLWDIELFEQAALDLRPEEDLVYRTIILVSIQRILRERDATAAVFQGDAPLPTADIAPVSMRRVAEVTRIPRETVRRHVQLLKDRGFVDDHPDGGVCAPASLRRRVSAGIQEKRLQALVSAINTLIDMGVLVWDEARHPSGRQGLRGAQEDDGTAR